MKFNLPHGKRTDHLPAGLVAAGKVKSTASGALTPSSANAGLAPSHEEIATWAEVLWRDRGCPHGCDDEIWLEAERRLGVDLRRRLERDRTALADPRFDFNRDSDGLMEELNDRFPGPTGKETTAL